jgi:hypothetical protein
MPIQTQFYNGRAGVATPPYDPPILERNQTRPRQHYRDDVSSSTGSFERSKEELLNRNRQPDYSFGIEKKGGQGNLHKSELKPRRESFYRQEEPLIETIKETLTNSQKGSLSPVSVGSNASIGNNYDLNDFKEKLEERKRELKPNVMRQVNTKITEIKPKVTFEIDAKVEVKPKPLEVNPKPVEVKPKPLEVNPKPVEVNPKPVEVKPKPLEVNPKPVETKPKPVETKVEAKTEINSVTTLEMSYNAVLPPDKQINHENYNVMDEKRLVVLDFVMGEQIQQIEGRLIYIPRQEIKLKVAPYIHTDDTEAFRKDVNEILNAAVADLKC